MLETCDNNITLIGLEMGRWWENNNNSTVIKQDLNFIKLIFKMSSLSWFKGRKWK